MFDEGSIVLKRISLSKFGDKRLTAAKRRLLFDKLYLMAEFNPNNDGYGCVITTMSKIENKAMFLTYNEIRKGLDWLHDNGFIHRERASRYCNNGYFIKINHYEKLNKLKNNQSTTKEQPKNNQSTSVTDENETDNTEFENQRTTKAQPTGQPKHNTYNQRKERNNKNNTKKKIELPEWVSNLYISKLAHHFNQSLEKVSTPDFKKLKELFKAVPDEEKMSKLFDYYFTLQDDFYKKRGYPLALLVKNQDTFFRAMTIITPQQGKLRKATV